MSTMTIDCDRCTARGPACADCVMTLILDGPAVELSASEQHALEVFSDLELVPPLRGVPEVALTRTATDVLGRTGS